MSVGAQVVRQQKTAHAEEHGDGLAVVPSHAGGKILRRLDAARCRFDRQPRQGHRRTRPPGVGIQDFVADQHALRRVGILHVPGLHVRGHGDRVGMSAQPPKLQIHRQNLPLGKMDGLADLDEPRRRTGQLVVPGRHGSEDKRTVRAGRHFGNSPGHQADAGLRHRLSLGIAELAAENGRWQWRSRNQEKADNDYSHRATKFTNVLQIPIARITHK